MSVLCEYVREDGGVCGGTGEFPCARCGALLCPRHRLSAGGADVICVGWGPHYLGSPLSKRTTGCERRRREAA